METREDVNVIGNAADLPDLPVEVLDDRGRVVVQTRLDVRRDQGPPFLRTEHDVIIEGGVGLRHSSAPFVGSENTGTSAPVRGLRKRTKMEKRIACFQGLTPLA